MLNRYSTLPKSTIINTQVLPDLGIIDKSLQRQQKNYDATAAATHKFQNDLAQKSAFGEYDNQVLAKFNEDAQNFVGSIADKDLGSPEVRNQFAGYVQSVASNPELKRIEAVKAMRGEYEKSANDLSAKGKIHDSQRMLHELAWNQYSETGDTSVLPKEPLYEAQDLIDARGKLVSMIKSSGHEGTAFYKGIAYGKSSSGVSFNKIGKAVQDQLSTYANSQAGKQEYNDWKAGQLTGAVPKGMKFEDYLLKQVMSTAQNYEQSNTSDNYAGAYNKAKEKEEVEATETSYLPTMKGKELKFPVDSNGDAIVSWTDQLIGWTTGEDATTEEKRQFNETIAANAKASKLTKSEYVKALKADPNVKVNLWTDTKKIDSESKRFYNAKTGGGDFFTRVIKNDKYPDGISAKEYMEKEGLSENELKSGFSVIGYTSPDNPHFAKGKVALINGQQVIIDDSHNASAEDRYKHILAKSKFSEDGTYTEEFVDDTNKRYKITSRYVVGEGGREVARELVK